MASREELVERMLRLPFDVQLSFYCHSLWAYDNAPEKARKIVEEYGGRLSRVARQGEAWTSKGGLTVVRDGIPLAGNHGWFVSTGVPI